MSTHLRDEKMKGSVIALNSGARVLTWQSLHLLFTGSPSSFSATATKAWIKILPTLVDCLHRHQLKTLQEPLGLRDAVSPLPFSFRALPGARASPIMSRTSWAPRLVIMIVVYDFVAITAVFVKAICCCCRYDSVITQAVQFGNVGRK